MLRGGWPRKLLSVAKTEECAGAGATSAPHEIDRDRPGLALHIANSDRFAVPRAELVEQRQRVVVVDEAHGFTGVQGIQGAENRAVPEALGDTASVEWIDRVRREVKMGGVGHGLGSRDG